MACARRSMGLALLAAVTAIVSGPALALDPAGTLVLYNQASADGQQIANYYAQVHPGVQVLGLAGVPTDEQVSWDVYLNGIRPQVLAALGSSIDCIVTTKGLPLRIDDPIVLGSTGAWNQYSSLESELTRIDTVSTRQLMGNQSTSSNSLAANPYSYKNARFTSSAYGIRLTARLDALTVADVKASIDRAQHAVYNRPGYTFVLDDDPALTHGRMASLKTNVLVPKNQPYIYDCTSSFVRSAPGLVLGYVSHGTHGGAPAHYLTDPSVGLLFSEASGAVFHTWESYNAYTFNAGVAQPYGVQQGLVAEWLARGGTAGVGNVQEPYASGTTVTNEDRMFQMLLGGYTFAEAAWNATRQLSYVNTVVGDPLMTWKSWVSGDANLDGKVDLSDVLIVKDAFGRSLGDPLYDPMADMDANGIVDLIDVLKVKENYVRGASGAADAWLKSAPEPSSLALLGLASALVSRRVTNRRTARA